MNILESYGMESPYGAFEECAKFTIDEVLLPFTLHDITKVDKEYTFSMWVKGEQDSKILGGGSTFQVTSEWTKHHITFIAKEIDFDMYFNIPGVYYVYHPQIEVGNTVTDWTPAVEDVNDGIANAQTTADDANSSAKDASNRVALAESLIQQLSDSISMLVTDGSGGSLMTQTADGGWTFSMAETNEALFGLSNLLNDLQTEVGNTNDTVEILESTMTNLGELASYVRIDKSGDKPLIELGTSDREFRLLITNTDIRFTQGSDVPAYISNRALYITKAVIEEEIQIGEIDNEIGGIVIKRRANGNIGWIWKKGV